jgi:hypothetical protein
MEWCLGAKPVSNTVWYSPKTLFHPGHDLANAVCGYLQSCKSYFCIFGTKLNIFGA